MRVFLIAAVVALVALAVCIVGPSAERFSEVEVAIKTASVEVEHVACASCAEMYADHFRVCTEARTITAPSPETRYSSRLTTKATTTGTKVRCVNVGVRI